MPVSIVTVAWGINDDDDDDDNLMRFEKEETNTGNPVAGLRLTVVMLDGCQSLC